MVSERRCSVSSCERKHYGLGYCHAHYQRVTGRSAVPLGAPLDRETRTVAQRFWQRVLKMDNGCWEWQGARDRRGYGRFGIEHGRTMLAHRHALEQSGVFVPDNALVLHRCDNPPCVNPAHLFLGTHQDNSDDAAAKGRIPRGEQSANAKLRWWQVRTIRFLLRDGTTEPLIARSFGVSRGTVNAIRRGKAWAWLT